MVREKEAHNKSKLLNTHGVQGIIVTDFWRENCNNFSLLPWLLLQHSFIIMSLYTHLWMYRVQSKFCHHCIMWRHFESRSLKKKVLYKVNMVLLFKENTNIVHSVLQNTVYYNTCLNSYISIHTVFEIRQTTQLLTKQIYL